MRMALLAAAVAAVVLSAQPASAQENWPQRTVTMIVPFGAGGTTDVVARLLATHLRNHFGQPFVIENRAGAGGNIGTAAVAKAPKDGYTGLFVSVATHAINQFVYTNMTHDPEKDFEPVVLTTMFSNVLVVNPSLPVKTLPEFIEYMRANPNKLSYGSAGFGTSQHLAGELLKLATGTQMVHVPFRGSGDIMTNILGGHIQVAFDNTALILPYVESGQLRALGIANTVRHRSLPDVPAIADTYPAVVASSWGGIVMPAGVPRPIIDKLNAEVRRALALPEIRAQHRRAGRRHPRHDTRAIRRVHESRAQEMERGGAHGGLEAAVTIARHALAPLPRGEGDARQRVGEGKPVRRKLLADKVPSPARFARTLSLRERVTSVTSATPAPASRGPFRAASRGPFRPRACRVSSCPSPTRARPWRGRAR